MDHPDALPSADAGTAVRPGRLRSVLLAQPRWLGDVLLCTPAVHALRRAAPEARIVFVTEAPGAAALDGNADLDDILVPPVGALARLRFLRHLARTGYDAVVDFRSTGSTAVMTGVTGAPVRVGTHGRGFRNRAYTHILPRETRPVYMARQKLAMLMPLGVAIESADTRLRIAIGGAERHHAGQVWDRAGFDAPVVAISGASRMPGKRWGAVHWARVADRIADAGGHILLTHGPGEREQAAAIGALMRQPALLGSGTTTVRELAALYERCVAWAGNDGGPKHIAAAAGAPTVAVIRQGIGAVWNDAADDRQAFVEVTGPCTECQAGPCIGRADEGRVADLLLQRLASR